MQKRRSEMQKDIIRLLQTNKIGSQIEMANLLHKNPSSVNRSINLLIKEGIIERSEDGYLLTSKFKDVMKTRDHWRYSSFGLERLAKDLNSSGMARAFENLDLISKTIKSYDSGIMGLVQSYQDSMRKVVSQSSLLEQHLNNSRGNKFLELSKITQQSYINISEMMRMRFQPVMENVAKLSVLFDGLMKMQFQASNTISFKLAALNSLELNISLSKSLQRFASGFQETTKYLRVYSNSIALATQKEFPDVRNNIFKFETASLLYKNLSLSLPYTEEMDILEISGFEKDFSIETLKGKELKKLLIKVNPELDRKREGAWECIFSENQDKYSQSANSMINLLDWTLRILAPDEDVKNHLNIGDEKIITKEMKLKYILRSNQDTKMINFYINNLLDIHKFLNNAKHSLKYDEGGALESLFYIIEGIILFLLKSNPENH